MPFDPGPAARLIESAADRSIGFWFMACQTGGFFNRAGGKVLLAILPAVITAVVTVTGVWLTMHDAILTLQLTNAQIITEHKEFRFQQSTEQELQNHRLNDLEKDLARMQGLQGPQGVRGRER